MFDTLLDEQTILGLALGAAVSGLLPIPEIQYLAYVHNAIDQLRGEAATLSFFSRHRYRNGMVVRIAGYGYQKGFGGHFHNDNALGGLRDIPGVVVASPATGADAAAMLRTCAAAATVDGTVSRVPRADRAVPHPRPARPRRRRLAHRAGRRPRADRRGAPRPRRRRRARGVVGQRPLPVAARRRAPRPRRASAAGCSTCAGWCRCPSPPSWPTPAAVGRVVVVDETRHTGRGRRSGRHRARRGRVHRPDPAASPRRTRSSRSATPPPSCSSPRTTSPTPSTTSCADPPSTGDLVTLVLDIENLGDQIDL